MKAVYLPCSIILRVEGECDLEFQDSLPYAPQFAHRDAKFRAELIVWLSLNSFAEQFTGFLDPEILLRRTLMNKKIVIESLG